MIAALALGIAIAQPPLTLEEIVARAPEAEARIARCRQVGPDCGSSPRELADAFVIRAVVAALSEGRVDRSGASNARFLDPAALLGWEEVLPGSLGEPEPWLAVWLHPPEVEPDPPRERNPLRLARREPAELRFGIGLSPGSYLVGELGAQARVPASGALSALVEVGARRGLHPAAWPTGWPRDPRTRAVVSDDLSLRLGLGPRWSRDGGAELHLLVGGMAARGSLDPVSRAAIAEMGATAEPVGLGVGLGAGAVGIHPLVPHGRIALCWEGWAQTYGTFARAPTTLAREPEQAVIGPPSPLRHWKAEAAFRFRPEPSGPSLWVGAYAEASRARGGAIRPSSALGPRLAGGWTL